MSLNEQTITVVGNIATEPKRVQTQIGTGFTTFRVASSSRKFDRETAAWVDGDTNWFTVNAYRELGEHAHASLASGERVIVVGRLRLRPFETDGQKRLSVEILADAVGPDLRWGTTAFHRSSARPSGAATDGDGHGHDGADVGAWAVPGQGGAEASVDEPVPF